MNYNYHAHTTRCHHASGTIEEYVINSINHGVKYLGFSDHAPFIFPDGFESGYRVPVSEAEDYVADISRIREKYKDKIEISIGFEMEYYPSHFKTMLDNVIRFGTEYLILGQHFIYEEHPDGIHVCEKMDNPDDLKSYVSNVVDGIKSGAFTYVAHPDIFNFTGDEKIYIDEMRKICIASRDCNVPLEINFLGIRGNRNYPYAPFWKIASEEKSPVTFGFDAHDPENTFDAKSLEIAKKMVEEYKLNYVGKPTLKKIQEIK